MSQAEGRDEWSAPYLAADGVLVWMIRKLFWRALQQNPLRQILGPVASTFKGDKSRARRKACWNPVLFQIPGGGDPVL